VKHAGRIEGRGRGIKGVKHPRHEDQEAAHEEDGPASPGRFACCLGLIHGPDFIRIGGT
jgi:hypothetical protein